MIKARNSKMKAHWNKRKSAVRASRAKRGLKVARTTEEENDIIRREAVETAEESAQKLLNGLNIDVAVNPQFLMDTIYGAVDGITAVFSQNCRGGIYQTIGSVEQVLDNMAFVIPNKLMKFNIAITGLSEGFNTTFAMCDLTPVADGFYKYLDYYHWDNYIIIGSRIGGYLAS
jgi:hypothetical protein